MNEKKISQLLMQHAVEMYPADTLNPTMQILANPIISYFETQTDLAKMYMVNKMLEDLLVKHIRKAIIEKYKEINSQEKIS